MDLRRVRVPSRDVSPFQRAAAKFPPPCYVNASGRHDPRHGSYDETGPNGTMRRTGKDMATTLA